MIRSKTNYLVPTLKEVPNDAEIVSHQLMVRAGMIRKLSAGLYTYLPLFVRVLRKVEAIIREELNRSGAQEVLMPVMQPAELWQKSGRWDVMGPEMLRLKNRQDRDFVLGPTHEEVITDLASREIKSYKQLPANYYQIQTKVRDEIRPRFGLMRAKEFIMKDGYSFHSSEECLARTYDDMYEAYHRIFKRCGLVAVAVEADSGAMGGNASAEFMVIADSGEDVIAFCDTCSYAANIEKASAGLLALRSDALLAMEEVLTPDQKTIEQVSVFLGVESARMIKTLFYLVDDQAVAVLIAGSDQVNETKLKNYLNAQDLALIDDERLEQICSTVLGFAGPVGLAGVRVIADERIPAMVNAVTGANKKDVHLRNVNWGRDFEVSEVVDLRLVCPGDACPRCEKGLLGVKNGIEVGHIFKLGLKYSEPMKAVFLNEQGKEQSAIMGCYGIGVTRTVAAIIEQHHDAGGIVWPKSVAPFDVCLVVVNQEDEQVRAKAEELYALMCNEGFDVLMDDREERPGFKFKDADLLGIPARVVVSQKLLKENQVEIKWRCSGDVDIVSDQSLLELLKDNFKNRL